MTEEAAFSIPTIRLSDNAITHDAFVQQMRAACLETGFFYVTNHGVEPIIDNLFEQSKLLFDLPLSEKKALMDPVLSRGYTCMREETLDPANQSIGDSKEGFYIAVNDISVDDDARYSPVKLAGPNQWPSSQTTPSMKDPEHFKKITQDFMNAALIVARKLIRLIAESLGLEATHFDKAFVEPLASLRLLHYDATQSDIDSGVFGCGAHSDYGMLTLLLTDENDGLQIHYKNAWIDVPPKADAFVVNLGDMLERWTNQKYKSTVHRVVNKTGRERYSIPFFVEPAFDTVVECLENCCDFTNPPKYPPTTSGEHLKSKYMHTHADFKPAVT